MPKAAALTSALTLCAFRAAGLEFGSGAAPAAAPSRLVVAPFGTHDARQRGKVIVSQDTISAFAANQKAAKLDGRLALDFEHNTVPGTPAYLAEREPRAIAAWATALAIPGEGIVYDQIEWTPAGLDAWKGKQFQDISPAVFRREDGTVIALHSAALCRHGEIDGLTIEAAAAAAPLQPFFAALSAVVNPSQSDPSESATATTSAKSMKALKDLLTALNIDVPEGADEAALVKAAGNAVSKIEELKKKDAPAPDAMSAEITGIKPELTALRAEVKTVTDERDALKRERLIAQAADEGKVIPLSAEDLKITPLNILEAIVKNAKAGEVPLGRKTPAGQPKGEAQPDALSAEDLKIAAAMCITEEEMRKSLGLPEKKAAA